MKFTNNDMSFMLKISLLFIILAFGVIGNNARLSLKNTNQDIIRIEDSKPSRTPTLSIKKVDNQSLQTQYIR